MKLTILQTGEVPAPLRHQFAPYADMFATMFDRTGQGFSYEVVPVSDGAPFPDLHTVEGVVITGSSAGVYENHAWLPPLRDFIRRSYDAGTPMRIAVWLAHVLEQVANVTENGPVSNRVIRIDEVADDAAGVATATGLALGIALSPAPALGPGRFATGHWRNYAEALAGPFAALNAVARRLGYPDN